MSTLFKKISFLLLLVGATPYWSIAQDFSRAAYRIDSLLATYHEDSPGISLKVSKDGRTIYRKDIGMADMEHGVPITDSTIFEAGSVSKQFTATAILVLAQEGKLLLDDPVSKHVPELPQYPQTITIRHLLNHTSGLKDWGALAGLGGWPRGSRQYTNELALGYIVKQPTLNNAPGDEYIYSNSNYTLLTIIAERVLGQSIPEFTRVRFFEPLGMSNTSWRDDHQRVVKRRAVGYSSSADGFQTNMPFENTYGHAALLTTIDDLERWNRSWKDAPIGGKGLVGLRTATGVLNDGTPITYASAVIVDEYLGHPRVYHTGSTAGYRALLTYYPEDDLSIAMLSNNAATGTGAINNELATILFGAPPYHTDSKQPDAAETAVSAGLSVPADIAGVYESEACGGTVRVSTDQGVIKVVWPTGVQQPFLLNQTGTDSFQAANQQTTLEFVRDESAQVTGFHISVARARNVWFGRTAH